MKKSIKKSLKEWMASSRVSCCSRRAARCEGSSWERGCEMEKQTETGTWKTRLFLSSSQLGLWKSERGPTWSRILLERLAGSRLFLSPVSLWLSNQSLTEPVHVPLVYILMNQGNYSSRFWSVSLRCFFHSNSRLSLSFPPLRSCLDNFRLSACCWITVSRGTKYVCELGLLPGCNAKGLTRKSHSIHTWNDGAAIPV